MRVLGLTGDIACGKSTVSKLLLERGAHVIDADRIVHQLYREPHVAGQVQALFEEALILPSGEVDRVALGRLVFADETARQNLEKLIHPLVAQRRAQMTKALPPGSLAVVYEAVKLLESGQGAGCDQIWCVTCLQSVQLERLLEQRSLTLDAARARMAVQPSRSEKSRLAGAIPLKWIENDGTLEELVKEVNTAWKFFMDLG